MARSTTYRLQLSILSLILLFLLPLESAESRQSEWGLKGDHLKMEWKNFVSSEADSIEQERSEGGLGSLTEALKSFRERAEPDISLAVGYHIRILNPAFVRDQNLLLTSSASDQYLYSFEIRPSMILRERIAVVTGFTFIPEQANFSEPVVLEFQNSRTVANEMIGYRGSAVSVGAGWLQPVTEGMQLGFFLGFTRMKLNLDERVRYHPADPFALNYRVTRLPLNNSQVTISNPYAALNVEFQLRRVRLEAGYDLQLFRLQQISSSGFHLSVKVRLSDLF